MAGHVCEVRKLWLNNCKVGREVAGVGQFLARGGKASAWGWLGGSLEQLGILHWDAKGAGRLRGESVVASGSGRAG